MSANSEQLLPPSDPADFESLCLDLWREIWGDDGAQKNGRSGQPQAGVDVFGRDEGVEVGVQCKQKDGLLRSKLTVRELEREVEASRSFAPGTRGRGWRSSWPSGGRCWCSTGWSRSSIRPVRWKAS